MAKVINIEKIFAQLRMCDLVIEDELSEDLPRCFGYPNECDDCETQKYSKIYSKKRFDKLL